MFVVCCRWMSFSWWLCVAWGIWVLFVGVCGSHRRDVWFRVRFCITSGILVLILQTLWAIGNQPLLTIRYRWKQLYGTTLLFVSLPTHESSQKIWWVDENCFHLTCIKLFKATQNWSAYPPTNSSLADPPSSPSVVKQWPQTTVAQSSPSPSRRQ